MDSAFSVHRSVTCIGTGEEYRLLVITSSRYWKRFATQSQEGGVPVCSSKGRFNVVQEKINAKRHIAPLLAMTSNFFRVHLPLIQ
jgi:hypothetical protein